MILSDKQKILIEFLVGRNKRVSLPCLSLISPKAIEKGLMGVSRMSRNVGVFFVFEKSGYHKMWMANTGLSLDIIFISEQGIVTEIVHGKPHDITAIGGNISSRYAVECIHGFVERNGILKGQRIKIGEIK